MKRSAIRMSVCSSILMAAAVGLSGATCCEEDETTGYEFYDPDPGQHFYGQAPYYVSVRLQVQAIGCWSGLMCYYTTRGTLYVNDVAWGTWDERVDCEAGASVIYFSVPLQNGANVIKAVSENGTAEQITVFLN